MCLMSSKMVVIIIAIIIQNKLDLAISSSWKFLQQNTQQEFASFTEVVWGSQFSLYVSFDQWLVKTWSVQVMVDNFFRAGIELSRVRASRVGWAWVLLKWRLEDFKLAAYMSRQRTSFRSAKAAQRSQLQQKQ